MQSSECLILHPHTHTHTHAHIQANLDFCCRHSSNNAVLQVSRSASMSHTHTSTHTHIRKHTRPPRISLETLIQQCSPPSVSFCIHDTHTHTHTHTHANLDFCWKHSSNNAVLRVSRSASMSCSRLSVAPRFNTGFVCVYILYVYVVSVCVFRCVSVYVCEIYLHIMRI